jgi:hypothetical protein
MALIAQSLTASGTEATYTFPSKLREIELLSNDSAFILSVAFGESVDTADQVIVLAANESITNLFIGSAGVMYYKGSAGATVFRLIGVSD